MTRQDILLAILSASNGRAYSPVQIQKAMFLVTTNLPQLVNEGANYAFQPYDYGPFDAQVYQDADRLENQGLTVVGYNGRYKNYAATQEGVEAGHRTLMEVNETTRNYIQSISDWVRKLPFEQLVREIYNHYPEMRANSIFQG